MKEIKCFIRPERLAAVLDALHAMPDLPGVTCSEVSGFGRARSAGSGVGSCGGMSKLEIVVPDSQVDAVKKIITDNAGTGRPGDGMIYVSPVAEAIRVRTSETLTD